MAGAEISFSAPRVVGEFLGCNDPMRMIVGPVGSGKSSGCCVEIARRAQETPPGPDGVRRSRAAVVRNTYRELEDTTIKTFKEWIPEPYFGRWRGSDHVFEMEFEIEDRTRVNCEVLFRALDRPDHVKKLLSLELTFVYFNEWKEIAEPVTFTMRTRVGRYPRRDDVGRYWTGIFGDTNPPDEDHYLYQKFEEERPEGWRVFKQPGGRTPQAENIWNLGRCWRSDLENGLPFPIRQALNELWEGRDHYLLALKPGDQERVMRILHARKEADERILRGEHEKPCQCYYRQLVNGARPDFVKVMVDGQYGFVQLGKPIYDEFNDSVHVTPEPIKINTKWKQLVGNDYGLTPAAIWMQQDPSDGQWQVTREFVSTRMGATIFGQEQAKICRTEYQGAEIEGWGDPAGSSGLPDDEERTVIDIINAQGMPMSAAPTNEFTLRRDAVGNLLTRLTVRGRPALVISPTCKKLRKAMNGAYCFKRLQVVGEARYREVPDKNEFSHVAEALQYAAVGAGEDRRALDGGETQSGRARVRVHMAGSAATFTGGQGHFRVRKIGSAR